MEHLSDWLDNQRARGNYRRLTPVKRLKNGRLILPGSPVPDVPLIDFSSNDYLGLSQHPEMIAAGRRCFEEYGSGSGAARLMSGDHELYHLLEKRLAAFKSREAALVFGSGYLANIGLISSLVGRGDLLLVDRLSHASIYDGCRLSGAKLIRFRHNDLGHLEELLLREKGGRRTLIVVESIYSMDGDRCPLRGLVALKNRYDALLMVDEAHATGVFGPNGGGVVQEEGLADEVDVALGTFGKALGSYGAYVAGTEELRELLINRARSFIFSTALPPAVIGASLKALDLVERTPGMGGELLAKAVLFREYLADNGVNGQARGSSQIVPVLIGASEETVALADSCRRMGVYVTAVRPPTVPEGSARLRFSICLSHEPDQLELAARVLADSARERGIDLSFL